MQIQIMKVIGYYLSEVVADQETYGLFHLIAHWMRCWSFVTTRL